MRVISKNYDLKRIIALWKRQHRSIAFVPTMGNLHEGHLSLIEAAKDQADRVVVSIFVNPTQFDRSEDLVAYPRTLIADSEKLKVADLDVLFAPSVSEIYPHKTTMTTLTISGIGDRLEGASRSGHFSGVATVVCKLFNLVQPNYAFFGKKDYQQLRIIQAVVADLNIPVKVIGIPTFRECDGLAMSSRNGYLTPTERLSANGLYRVLQEVVEKLKNTSIPFVDLEEEAKKRLIEKGFKPDYVTICCADDLQIATRDDNDLVILGAAWLGQARLIDNICLKKLD